MGIIIHYYELLKIGQNVIAKRHWEQLARLNDKFEEKGAFSVPGS